MKLLLFVIVVLNIGCASKSIFDQCDLKNEMLNGIVTYHQCDHDRQLEQSQYTVDKPSHLLQR